jgi:starvation-inducible DNA-binding protein
MQQNQDVINFLNQQVSNFAVLYVKLHRYHWFIQSSNFFGLHEKFEEFYKEAAGHYDELAERVLTIGGKPLATMSKYLKETTLVEAEADDTESEMLAELHEDFRKIVSEIKEEGMKLCEQRGDEPSNDLLIHIQGSLEKHAWMLEATMEKR